MKLLTLLLALLVSHFSYAAKLKVSVSDSENIYLPGTVVYLIPSKPIEDVPEVTDIMDQVDRQFKPHILTVQTGTLVHFPNSDSIKHHVYSFSAPKRFELPLYKGTETDPLLFDKPGLVELGCNVHDWMLGYILVVDTPYFARTNEHGIAEFDVPSDNYTVKVWHPRIQDSASSLQKSVNLAGQSQLDFSLDSPLLPGLDEYEEDDEFSDYE